MTDLFGDSRSSLPFRLPEGPGYHASWNEHWRGFDIEVPGGELFFAETFFAPAVSDRTVEYFQENDRLDWKSTDWKALSANELAGVNFTNVRWKQDWIKLYGKRNPLPRLTAWYGDPGREYTYSGIKSAPNEWNEGLLYLKTKVEEVTRVRFNSVLLNWYRDGSDHLSWHADDEPELGPRPVIASANFGAGRDFALRRKDDKTQKIIVPLRHGTLLVMRGDLQQYWEHSVPRRKNVTESRFNLTFRRIGELT